MNAKMYCVTDQDGVVYPYGNVFNQRKEPLKKIRNAANKATNLSGYKKPWKITKVQDEEINTKKAQALFG